MNKKLLFLVLIALAGCSKGEKKSPNVFFAGQIVNPTSNYVVLYKGDVVIDSAKLDESNRFIFRLDSVTEGLHHFNHEPEYQYVFLEQGDSLQIRLNTIDFDESLVFTGNSSAADINNFLLDLFLSKEEEERDIYKEAYSFEPVEFSGHIDSLHQLKLNELKALETETELSYAAIELAEASIDYTYFIYKEEYPFEHKKHLGQKVIKNLPPNFYDYRKNIRFNNQHFNYLTPYYDFIKAHIKNLTFSNCSELCEIKNDVVRNQLHFNRHKLSIIDSLVNESELKDNLFRNVAINYLLMSNDNEQNIESFILDFYMRSGNNRHLAEIEGLYQGIRNIQPQKKIPNVMVSDINGNTLSLQDISQNGKVVFYFWTGDDKRHFNNITKRANYLSGSKTDYTFVGINVRTDFTTWKGMVEHANLEPKNQYKAENFEEISKTLILYPLNKCIITKDATIVDAFSNMYTASL